MGAQAKTVRERVESGADIAAVKLDGITVGYDGKAILKQTDLNIGWGLMVGVIGPNGAGKSTLIKAILGTLKPMSGSVAIGGHISPSKDGLGLIGYVPQREVVNWNFPVTVADVVMMGRTARLGWLRFPGREDRRVVTEALERVGMSAYAGRQISQLSGGQQQRVFLARALAQGGRLLLLDEPLNGVDAGTQQAIGTLLHRARDEGGTVLIATHDLELAAAWCDRLIMVNHGIVGFGTPAQTLRPEVLRRTYGGQVLVVPSVPGENGTEESRNEGSEMHTVVPDVHGHPGGQPPPGLSGRQ